MPQRVGELLNAKGTKLGEWLIKRFIPRYERVSDPEVRNSYGFLASVVGVAINVVLALMKASAGLIAGSISVIADALNNLSDAAAAVASLVGFSIASRPADEAHPFGHGRAEYLAGLAVAVIVCAVGINLVVTSIGRIANPTPLDYSWITVIVLVISIGAKIWLMFFDEAIARRISSKTLAATAFDARADAIATTAVLVAAVITKFTGVVLDGWMGLIIGAFIIWSGYNLVVEAISPLLGEAPNEKLADHIQSKILSYDGILGTHDLMVHDYGPGRQFASAHVEMAAEGNVLESHDLIDNIEQDFKREGIIMTLHFDPIVTDDPTVKDLRNFIDSRVKEIDPRLSIHDLRTVPGITHTNVIFDIVRPRLFALHDDELAQRVSQIVAERQPDAICKITIDTSYVSTEQ